MKREDLYKYTKEELIEYIYRKNVWEDDRILLDMDYNRSQRLLNEDAIISEKDYIEEMKLLDKIRQVMELEKENAEAKEIINEFLSYYHSNDYPYQMLEILGKAEQFLKED